MIRTTFLDAAGQARTLLATPEVAEHWDHQSALTEFTVRGLAGHLVRGATSVEAYLDRDEPEGEPIGAAAYFAAAVGDTTDLASPVNVGVRARGEELAAEGQVALLATLDAAVERLRPRLDAERRDRRVRVFADMVLTLDDYLVTRLVELVVHIDDLAVSVGLPTPELPTETVVATLVDIARLRHGDLAVVRALARRERDAADALRVL